MERVRKPTTLPTTLIAWGADPFVLAALRSAVRAVPGAGSPRFGV